MKNYTKMSTEKFQKFLFKKFKFLYRDHILPTNKTRLCDGICCREGWNNLLYNLSKDIMKILKKDKKYKNIWSIQKEEPCMTIKDIEKYGNFKYKIIERVKYKWLAKLKCKFGKGITYGDEGFKVSQIKEKFGGLRYYTDNSNDEIYDLISKYELQSEMICEECGKFTNESNLKQINNWVYNLCDICYSKFLKEKNIKFGIKQPMTFDYEEGLKVNRSK